MKKRTYTDKPLGDTEWLLEQWGSWRMDGMGVPRYVSPSYGAGSSSGFKEYTLTDNAALVIDSIVARLGRRNQQMGDFVWLYFGAKWTMVRIGEQTKDRMAERKVREIIRAGVAWVDAALEISRDAA